MPVDASSNKATLTHIYRRWHDSKGAALDELIGIFDRSILFSSLAEGATPAAFTALAIGPEQLRGYFDGLLSGWSMNFYRVDTMIAEDDRVAVVGATSWTNKSTGKTVETRKVDIWRFENGRATEFHEYYDTAKLYAAATP